MSKYKKLLIVVIVAVLGYFAYTHYAHAQTAAAATTSAPVNFGGTYVGFDTDLLNFDNTSTSTNTTYHGSIDGHAGYGIQTSQGYYVGGELADGKQFGTINTAGNSETLGNEFDADVRAGKVIDNFLAYGKVGYVGTEVTSNNAGDGSANSAFFSGVQAGAGVEHFLAPNVTARAELIYTDYASQYLDSVKLDPSNVKATVGVSYKFQ